jgi:single-strand DNA-binding protein
MADLNQVFLIGNLTRDPEVRYAPSGDAVGDLRMAINRKYKTRDGQEKDETCFVSVVVWGRQAETCAQYLHKGSLIMVDGRLQYDQWEKDGQKQSRLLVRANRVQFLGAPRAAGEGARAAPAGPAGMTSAPDDEEKAGPGPEPSPAGGAAGGDDDNLPF